jgi:2-oxoglutarate dehydrogenase E2 component (dihydrolipoamide succinyltransferase)
VNWRATSTRTPTKSAKAKNLTFNTPIFVQAVPAPSRIFRLINVSIDGDYIIKKRDINIGVAVPLLPSGNLIVPIIH